MSEKDAELRARIADIEQFDTVVSALRGVAITYAQQGRERIAAVSRHAETVAEAIAHAHALATMAEREAPHVVLRGGRVVRLLFCAEHGFAGTFSKKVLDCVQDDVPADLLIVGRRGMREAAERGLPVPWCAPMIAHPDAVGALTESLVQEIFRRTADGSSAGVALVFTRPTEGNVLIIERRSLLPLDMRRFHDRPPLRRPLIQLPPGDLLRRLVGEYLRAELASAVLHSFTAENVARMMAMSAARENIADRLDHLRFEAQHLRQEAITAELLELVAGATAIEALAPVA